jgi:hypothetical protein
VLTIDKYEKKNNYSCELFQNKRPQKNDLVIFWFFNHSLGWFLMMPPKDAFTHITIMEKNKIIIIIINFKKSK